MLFGFWQFKTTVSLLLLASCLGQELLRTCDRDYCYERSIERRNIKEDRLREWRRGERFHDDTEHKNKIRQEHSENRLDAIRGVGENRVDKLDFEYRRRISRDEIPRKLDTLTSNRKEFRVEESQRIRDERHRIMIDDNNAITDDSRRRVSSRRDFSTENKRESSPDVGRGFDETRKTERLNERENQKLENREDTRYSDRLSETRTDLEQRRQHDVNKVSIESRRLDERIADSNTKQLQRKFEERSHIDERSSSRRADLIRIEDRISEDERRLELSDREGRLNVRELLTENRRINKYFAEDDKGQERRNRLEGNPEDHEGKRRLPQRENQRTNERFYQTELEKENVRRIQAKSPRDNTKRASENESGIEISERDDSRRPPLREPVTLNKYERRLNERERFNENRRLMENISEDRQERVNNAEKNHESRRSVERFSDTERLAEEPKDLKRLIETENQRTSERLSQTVVENEPHRNSRHREVNRQSSSFIAQLDKHFQIRSQLFNEDNQERERSDRRDTLRQLDIRGNRYDVSKRLGERERQSRNTLEYSDNRVGISKSDSEINQREPNDRREILKINNRVNHHDIISRLNDRFERQYTNLRERKLINRNLESRRLNSRLIESEKEEALQSRDEIQRYIEESRNIDERKNIFLDKNMKLTSFKLRRDSVERNRNNLRKHDEQRKEFKENKRENNRALNKNEESRRFDERNFDKNENSQMRMKNQNIPTRSPQSNMRQNDNLLQRAGENNLREHNERFNERIDATRNDENINYRDFHYKIDNYKEKPTVFLNRSFVAVGQGAVLAYVILKTLNGKNDIKYNIYQKLQGAVALMGF